MESLTFIYEIVGCEYNGILPCEACNILTTDNLAESFVEDLNDYVIKNVNGHLEAYKYGKFICSGYNKTDLEASSRELENQSEKHESTDHSFAIDFKLYESLWN